MSRSRQAWSYTNRRAKGSFAPNPFDGLPSAWIQQLGENSPEGILGIQGYFNHFIQWEGPVAEGSASGWLLSGVTGVGTIVLTNNRHGEIQLTADATANADPCLAFGSATLNADFRPIIGKRIWFFVRLNISTAATPEVFIGLGTPDTEPTVTNTFPSDGIFFHKAAAATTLSFDARKDGTSTSKAGISGTLTDATFTTIGFLYDSKGNILPYQDGALLPLGVIPVGTANIPIGAADVMQPMIGFRGASINMALDWILFAQER